MIKDVCSKFDYYSISPKIRQSLFHWSYELIFLLTQQINV